MREEFEQKFSKNSNARGVARGGCRSFDLTGTLFVTITRVGQGVRDVCVVARQSHAN